MASVGKEVFKWALMFSCFFGKTFWTIDCFVFKASVWLLVIAEVICFPFYTIKNRFKILFVFHFVRSMSSLKSLFLVGCFLVFRDKRTFAEIKAMYEKLILKYWISQYFQCRKKHTTILFSASDNAIVKMKLIIFEITLWCH